MYGGVVCLLCFALSLLFESLPVALMTAERAEVDFATAIRREAEPLWVHHLPVSQSQSVSFEWPCVVRPKNGHNRSWDLLLWVGGVRVTRLPPRNNTHRITAEPFCLYTSHFAPALKPLNAPELSVLGGSSRSHSCQFVNFVLFSVNVPFFFSSVNRHPFCDKLLLVPPHPPLSCPYLSFYSLSAGRWSNDCH